MPKKLIAGHCDICGRPVLESEFYAMMEYNEEAIVCPECWDEYLKGCNELYEKMKREKRK